MDADRVYNRCRLGTDIHHHHVVHSKPSIMLDVGDYMQSKVTRCALAMQWLVSRDRRQSMRSLWSTRG